MNSTVLFVVLCLFIFDPMAFAEFMQRQGRKRRDDWPVDPENSRLIRWLSFSRHGGKRRLENRPK
jgi:hypothetical protein